MGQFSRGQVRRYLLGGVPICAMSFDATVGLIVAAGSRERPARIHFCSAKDIVEATSNLRFRQILNDADYVIPDGMPLVWYGRIRGHPVRRVTAPDGMFAVLQRGRDRGARHYFYGGTYGVAAHLAAVLKRRLPGLDVVGHETPPFRSLTPDESAATITRINDARPTHVWVGIGSPKQDFWIARHADALRCGAVLSVGAAFDFLAGTRRRAPRWMQNSGTEWFHRLLMEPRRLGRRYTVTNARFIAIFARELAATRRSARADRVLTAAPEAEEPPITTENTTAVKG